jgi:hypothetical protein
MNEYFRHPRALTLGSIFNNGFSCRGTRMTSILDYRLFGNDKWL